MRLCLCLAAFVAAPLFAADETPEPAPATPLPPPEELRTVVRLLTLGESIPDLVIVAGRSSIPAGIQRSQLSPPILYEGTSPITFMARLPFANATTTGNGASGRTAEVVAQVAVRPASRNLLIVFLPRQGVTSRFPFYTTDYPLPSPSVSGVRLFSLVDTSAVVLVGERQKTVEKFGTVSLDVTMAQAGDVRVGVGVDVRGDWRRVMDRPVRLAPGHQLLLLLLPDPAGANGVAIGTYTDTQALALPIVAPKPVAR